ncbi:hypothetical protein HJFPF1_04830 [Paramyrothecium foliicola]|nr:hypothetical protein HJFPF1_04830 [Paramyrothecium foliicola]
MPMPRSQKASGAQREPVLIAIPTRCASRRKDLQITRMETPGQVDWASSLRPRVYGEWWFVKGESRLPNRALKMSLVVWEDVGEAKPQKNGAGGGVGGSRSKLTVEAP